jgi:tetratricopeptide (TPR) repeat protein
VRGDLARAVASQEKAVSIETHEPRLYYELDQLLAWTKAPLATRLKWLQASPQTVARREITRGRLARVQALMGRYDDALATLGEGRFRVWEGERGIHEVYVQARLQKGLARLQKSDAAAALEEFRAAVTVPPNIEVGSGAGSHLAAAQHHAALALAALGRKNEATAAFRNSAASPAPLPDCHYWIGRSLERLDKPTEARLHFERLAATRPRAVDASRPLEQQMEMREAMANDHYLRALGLLGLGRRAEARAALAQALEADPDNMGAALLRLSLAATGPRAAPSPRPSPRPQVEAPARLPAEAPPEVRQ